MPFALCFGLAFVNLSYILILKNLKAQQDIYNLSTIPLNTLKTSQIISNMLTPFISQNTWTKHSITPPRSFDRGGTFASGNMKKSSIAKKLWISKLLWKCTSTVDGWWLTWRCIRGNQSHTFSWSSTLSSWLSYKIFISAGKTREPVKHLKNE